VKVDIKKINDYTRELDIEIAWSDLKADFDNSLKKFSKKVKIPGFRPGKVPKDRLLNQYQPNIEADFMDDNFQKYYLMAIDKKNVMPVNKAEIKDVHFRMSENFKFKATFEIEPEVNFPKLKKGSLKVQKTTYVQDDSDLEDAILQLRKSHATISTVEEGAIEGDYLICTLQKLDDSGVAIIGKKFEKQYLRVGNGSFSESQKEKMIGLKPGESARVTLPVSKDGGDAEYELTVDNVEREILPDVDEKFLALINPNLKTVEELNNDVQEKIKSNFEERSKTSFERDLTDSLINLINPSFSPAMVQNYLANLVEDVKKQNQGEPLDEDKVREHYLPVAERNVKWYSIRNKLIETENLSVSKEDTEAEIERLVNRTPASEKEIRKFYKKPSNKSRIEDDLLEKKILDHLIEYAKIKEVSIATKELRGAKHEH
jgi:trigger factor